MWLLKGGGKMGYVEGHAQWHSKSGGADRLMINVKNRTQAINKALKVLADLKKKAEKEAA